MEKITNKASTTQVVELIVQVIYTPLDDALGSACHLRTKADTIITAGEFVANRLEEIILEGSACSLVVAERR